MKFYTENTERFIPLTAKTVASAKREATKAQAWEKSETALFRCSETGTAVKIAKKVSGRWSIVDPGERVFNPIFEI